MAKPNRKRFDLDIRQINYIKKVLEISKIEDVDKATMKQLKENLKQIKDIRIQKKTKFEIVHFLFFACLKT